VHELSIAEAVLRIAEAHARGRRIEAVGVRVGALRQVVPSALAFAFELVSEGATLEIEEVEAAVRCARCGAETTVAAFPLACGACGALDVEPVRGEELEVAWLELEQPEPAVAGASGRS
jgi:hydrogenase nickel incorporation protein HypA/HybF